MRIHLVFTVTPEQMLAFSRAEERTGRRPNALISFYEFAGRGIDSFPATSRIIMKAADQVIIDSGAFTFRYAGARKQLSLEDYDEYLRRYIEWVKHAAVGGIARYWVELDIGKTTGEAWIKGQREKWIAAGLGRGLINVWHSIEHDWNYWLYLLDEAAEPGRSRYVALESSRSRAWTPHDYKPFVMEAIRRGVRVHGFMITSQRELRSVPYYSVDSSTWIMPIKYGRYLARTPDGEIKQFGLDKLVKGVGPLNMAWRGILPRRTALKDRVKIYAESATFWLEFEHMITEYWKRRGIDWSLIMEEFNVG